MKNILIIGNYPPPYGGVPHHIERLTQYLSENGWTCHVLAGGTTGNITKGSVHIYKPTHITKVCAFAQELFNNTFSKWLEKGSLNRDEKKFWIRYKMYANVGAKIILQNKIQIIVSYNLLTYAPVGAYLANKFKLPHLTNIFGEVYKHTSMHNSKAFFHKVANTAHTMLSCSSHCGKSVKELGIEDTVHTVTYGINIHHFTPGEPKKLREKIGIGDSPVVLFLGRLSLEMGLDSFLTASTIVSDSLPDTQFIIVGQSGDYVEEAQKKCELSNGKFLLIRNVPYTELPEYYRLASIVVVPTRGDRTCSSLAAMEAMATRKPVIGYAIGGIPEIIEHNITGLLVQSEDVQSLAKSMKDLLTNTTLCERLAKTGYEKSQISFDENQVNRTMEKHFLNVLSDV